MPARSLVFVRFDGSGRRTLVDEYPSEWRVVDGLAYQRSGHAIAKAGDEDQETCIVYVQRPWEVLEYERTRARNEIGSARRRLRELGGDPEGDA